MGYSLETQFAGLCHFGLSTFGASGQGVFLHRQMGGDLVFGLLGIDLPHWFFLLFWVYLKFVGCVRCHGAEAESILRMTKLNKVFITLKKNFDSTVFLKI